MNPILSLKQAPAATLDLLIERPELAVVFWMSPDHKPQATPGWVLWIAKLFGHYEVPLDLPEAPPELDRRGTQIALDQPPATVSDLTDFPHGKPIAGSTHGYGDDRAVWPDESPAVAEALGHPTATEFLDATQAASLGVVMKLS